MNKMIIKNKKLINELNNLRLLFIIGSGTHIKKGGFNHSKYYRYDFNGCLMFQMR